jgi:hypothetical protein
MIEAATVNAISMIMLLYLLRVSSPRQPDGT